MGAREKCDEKMGSDVRISHNLDQPLMPKFPAHDGGSALGRPPGQTKAPVVIRGLANASWYAAYLFQYSKYSN
jgi:hypothetical protein